MAYGVSKGVLTLPQATLFADSHSLGSHKAEASSSLGLRHCSVMYHFLGKNKKYSHFYSES